MWDHAAHSPRTRPAGAHTSWMRPAGAPRPRARARAPRPRARAPPTRARAHAPPTRARPAHAPPPPPLPPRSLRAELRKCRELLSAAASVEAGLQAEVARLRADVADEQSRGASDVASMQASLHDLHRANATKTRRIADLQAEKDGSDGRSER